MSTIKTGTTLTTAYQVEGDTTGALVIQTGSTPTTAMTIDTSQNVGIGVSPSAWGSSYRALQFNAGSLFSNTSGTGLYTVQNTYYNGTNWIGSSAGTATIYTQQSGAHQFFSNTVTAGGTFTPTTRMSVDTDGTVQLYTGSLAFSTAAGVAQINNYRAADMEIVNRVAGTGINFYTGAGVYAAKFDSSGNFGLGVTTPSTNSVSLDVSKNLVWQYQGANSNYANIFNQNNSAALVLACGLQRSASVNGYASSYAGSWAKSAITVGYGFVSIATNAPSTVAVGTDVTMAEKLRVDYNGTFTKYDSTMNTYVRDFGCYSAANTYLHIKFNVTNSSNRMLGWRLYGYQAYNTFIDTYYGCYLYSATPATPYGSIVRDAGSASGGAMYYSTDGYLCISCQINPNNYTGLRLESLVNGGDYGGGIDVAVLAYKGYATATGAY